MPSFLPSPSPGVCSNSCPLSWRCHQPSHPLLIPFTPAFNLSQHQGLSNELALCIRWPKYWSFSISLANAYSGLISFRTDWFDLLSVQETLKSLFHVNTKGQFSRASFGKYPRFQIQLDKRPLSPGTSREASGVPCLNPRRGHSPVPSLQGPCDRSLKSEVPCGSCLNWR